VALEDLRELRGYVGRRNPVGLRALLRKMTSLLGQVAEHPDSGARLDGIESDYEYRQVVFAPYRLIYRSDGEQVIVIRIWHGRRDPRTLDVK